MPEWMLTEKDRKPFFTYTRHSVFSASDRDVDDNGLLLAQARKLVKWLAQECNKHIPQMTYKVIRAECGRCMEQLRKDVGL